MILKLTPACKDYLWGGEKLRTEFQIPSALTPLAEAWALSCHEDGPSVIQNGPFCGQTLSQFLARQPGAAGSHAAALGRFPVLVKLIDAQKDLSIQVHPSDEYAAAHGLESGKTEAWYILEHEPGAVLYYGFSRTVSEEELARRIRENTLLEVLNAVPVHRGDVFFIEAGTVHAIGAGILLAEVQQNANITYRVYDYGRLGADGKPRALHIPQALAVARRCPPAPAARLEGALFSCRYFTTDLLEGDAQGTADETSFVSLLAVEGAGEVRCCGETLAFQKGDSLFLPAGSGPYTVNGRYRALRTTV